MSSPLTTGLVADPLTTLLAAAAIRTAQALAEGLQEAHRLQAEHAGQLAENRNTHIQSEQAGMLQLLQQEQEVQERLETLARLGDRFGIGAQLRADIPDRPDPAGQTELSTYIRSLEAFVEGLQSILMTEAGLRHPEEDSISRLEDALTLLPATQAPAGPSAHILARIAHLEIPEEITTLALEYDNCQQEERAGLLGTELRLRVTRLLQEARQKALDAATVTVIEQSLKDLGYQVEPIADTLYMEGGMLHFQRAGWGDYMVRMRLDFRQGTANFNVIRAIDEQGNARSVADHLAEDRWCAEFPALMRALEAQGIQLPVTRRVEPGDLPVQQVPRRLLPSFAEEDATRATITPLARKL